MEKFAAVVDCGSFVDQDGCCDSVTGLIEGGRTDVSSQQTPPAHQIQHAQSRRLSRSRRTDQRYIGSAGELLNHPSAEHPTAEQQLLFRGEIERSKEENNKTLN